MNYRRELKVLEEKDEKNKKKSKEERDEKAKQNLVTTKEERD